jgi:hypothetical protein
MTAPTEDSYRALARSAPWLFRSLHFTQERPDDRGRVEAWLSRPGRLLVALANGERWVQRGTPWNNGQVLRGGRMVEDVRPHALQFSPERRPDGLVRERPADPRIDFDDPLWSSYDWVAMLDPVELSHHTSVSGLEATERHGRETWWAEVAALDGYEPRCGCCPLLWGRISERDEGAIGGPTYAARHPDVAYPEAWLVALDRATGVVVDLSPIGGDRKDVGFGVRILEVDPDLPDSLFEE